MEAPECDVMQLKDNKWYCMSDGIEDDSLLRMYAGSAVYIESRRRHLVHVTYAGCGRRQSEKGEEMRCWQRRG